MIRKNARKIGLDRGGWCALPAASAGYRPWLAEKASLTRRIQRRLPPAQAFRVRVLAQGHGRPDGDQLAPLGLHRSLAIHRREVLLLGGDQALVYALSLMPAVGRRHPWRAWYGLGNKALGSLLFSRPSIHAGDLACARLDRRHPLYRRAARWIDNPPAELWARRAVFTLDRMPLLVCEVFLPAILDLK